MQDDVHDGVNFVRTACVIAVSRSREIFEPLIHQVCAAAHAQVASSLQGGICVPSHAPLHPPSGCSRVCSAEPTLCVLCRPLPCHALS
jgi:hypothetical protein